MIDMNLRLSMSSSGPGFNNNLYVGKLPSYLYPYEDKIACLLINTFGDKTAFLDMSGINGDMYIRQYDNSGSADFKLLGEFSYYSGSITPGNVVPGG